MPLLLSRGARAGLTGALAQLCCTLLSAQTSYEPPAAYYASAVGQAGSALKSALHMRTRGHTQIPYTHSTRVDVWDAVMKLDEDPANPVNVLLVYSGYSAPKSAFDSTGDGIWNREHLWPVSYGPGSTSTLAGTDLHHLRACDSNVNTRRSNDVFDVAPAPYTTDPEAPLCREHDNEIWEPRDADKGALARAMLYMAVRYEPGDDATTVPDLELSDSPDSGAAIFGVRTTLLRWHRAFPATAAERRRNHLIDTLYQRNRNPFVDVPYFADLVFVPGATPWTAWRGVQFPAAQAGDELVSGAGADPDADGLANLLEAKLHRPPLAAEPDAGFTLVPVTISATPYAQLTHRLNRFATDITLTYETSSDLVTWTVVSPVLLTTTSLDAVTDLVTVRVPAGPTHHFVRLRATR